MSCELRTVKDRCRACRRSDSAIPPERHLHGSGGPPAPSKYECLQQSRPPLPYPMCAPEIPSARLRLVQENQRRHLRIFVGCPKKQAVGKRRRESGRDRCQRSVRPGHRTQSTAEKVKRLGTPPPMHAPTSSQGYLRVIDLNLRHTEHAR